MKKILTYLSILLSYGLFGQTITVLDESQNPLPYCDIICYDLKGKIQNTLLTTKNGTADIVNESKDINSKLIISISYVGYNTLVDTVAKGVHKSYMMKPSSFALNQVVVTAQYTPKNPEEAVHKIKIIDRKRMDAQGAVNLKDVLQNEQNIRLSQDNILGSSLNMQDVSGQNIKILIDGVAMVGRLNGNIDLSHVNLNNIERIEIVEGPLSVNYGTDALGGTINLISKKEQKKPFNFSMNSYYETAGQYNLDGSLGWKKNNSQWLISGGRNYFDGWSPTDAFFQFPKSLPADTDRFNQWNPKEQYFGKIQYSYQWKELNIRPYIEYFTEKITNRGRPRKPHFKIAFDDYYNTWRKNGGIDLSGKISKSNNLKLIAAYNDFKRIKNTYSKDLTTLAEQLSENTSDQDTSKFSSCMSRASLSASNDSSRINYEIGYDISYEKSRGRRIKGLEKEQGNYAAFLTTEWVPFTDFTIRPGVRYGYNTQYEHPIIPSLNLKYSFKPNEKVKWTIRSSYARGFRAPSLKELHFEFIDINHNIVGNQDLDAEKSNNYNLYVTWKKVKSQNIKRIEIGAYYNDISSLITLAQSQGTQFTYINVGKYKTKGIQSDFQFSWEHLKWNIGGICMGFYNDLSDTIKAISGYNYSLEIRSNFIYDFHKWKASIAAFYKYIGARKNFSTLNDEIVETQVADYQTLDLSVTKHLLKNRSHLTIGCKNLFDIQDITTSGAIGSGSAHTSNIGSVTVNWGRTLFTSLKINLD